MGATPDRYVVIGPGGEYDALRHFTKRDRVILGAGKASSSWRCASVP
jgi:hypothetical protein